MKVSRLYNVLYEPHVTEKVTNVGDISNQYAFKVAIDATKRAIKQAVETLFEVNVLNVSTVRVKGKRKRRINGVMSQQKHWKKAYVRLAEDISIDFTKEIE